MSQTRRKRKMLRRAVRKKRQALVAKVAARLSGRYVAQPEHGDIMSIETFKRCVTTGGFIDYDGWGHPMFGDLMDPHCTIFPSAVSEIPANATHIVWFNR